MTADVFGLQVKYYSHFSGLLDKVNPTCIGNIVGDLEETSRRVKTSSGGMEKLQQAFEILS